MAHWFQELETDGKAVVAQALAISDAGLGAKIARKQFERYMIVAVPAADGKDAGAAGADVFRKSGLHTGNILVTRDVDGNGHRNPFLDARCSKGFLHAAPQDKRTEKPIYKQAAIRDNPISLPPRFMP